VVHVAYYTDPLCPWSWAAEAVVRRLEVEFSEQLLITYVMVGMSREIDAAAKLAATLDAMAASGMPADPRVWLESPPRSSYPACLAVKAAADQGLDAPYLRRLREGVMLHRERLDTPDPLVAAARQVSGIDLTRFEIDVRSDAIVELFADDRRRAQAAGQGERPEIPAFAVDDGPLMETGELEPLRTALLAAGATAGRLPDVEVAVGRFGAIAAAEVSSVCGLSSTRARVELWRLAGEFRVQRQEVVCGELWRALTPG